MLHQPERPARPLKNVLIVTLWARQRRRGRSSKYALSLVSAGFLIVSLAAIVSFLCLYIYEMPTHRCPFSCASCCSSRTDS